MEIGLFEVKVKNRVVKGNFNSRPISGTQGNWYQERLLFLAESKEEAEGFAFRKVKSRKYIGISRVRRRKVKFRREIVVLDVRRVI